MTDHWPKKSHDFRRGNREPNVKVFLGNTIKFPGMTKQIKLKFIAHPENKPTELSTDSLKVLWSICRHPNPRPHGKSAQESSCSADLENENARVFTAFPVSLTQTFSSALDISRANNPIRRFTVSVLVHLFKKQCFCSKNYLTIRLWTRDFYLRVFLSNRLIASDPRKFDVFNQIFARECLCLETIGLIVALEIWCS